MASGVIKKTVGISTSFKHDRNEVHEIQGGFLRDTRYSWLSHGAQLHIKKASNGVKVLDHTFSSPLCIGANYITCVADLQFSGSEDLYFAVGLQYDGTQGMVCIFGPKRGGHPEIIRAILMPSIVLSLSLVSGDDLDDDASPLSSAICNNYMHGVLGVGLLGGEVLLMNMGLHGHAIHSDESTPSHVLTFTVRDDLEDKMEEAALTGQHLALILNSGSYSGDHYLLQTPEGQVEFKKKRKHVSVTALLYVPQISSIVVGFNFGVFQIWSLVDFSLLYTSPLLNEFLDIAAFCFQEPSDDPRNYCYLWSIHDKLNKNRRYPLAVMYSLVYRKKHRLPQHGVLYKDMTSCEPKFEYELGRDNESDDDVLFLSCQRVEKEERPIRAFGGNPDTNTDVSLVLFAWRTLTPPANVRLTLFDLNRWYEAQMPRMDDYTETFTDTRRVFPTAREVALAAAVATGGAVHFEATITHPEHTQPSAATYESVSLFTEHIYVSQHEGVQELALSALSPFSIANPTELFKRCIAVGLRPILTDAGDSGHHLSVDEQRDYLLSVALENHLRRVVSQCASTWTNGCQAVLGASLEAWLAWAWRRALACKRCIEKIGVPLFDYSGDRLDDHSSQMLAQSSNQLARLASIYDGVVSRSQKNSIIGQALSLRMLEHSMSLTLAALYAKMLRWFVDVGLLPEALEADVEQSHIPYPFACLASNYRERRFELKEMSNAVENRSSLGDCSRILYIDGLLVNECRELSTLWANDGGNGLYPPPSLQSLLHMYLLKSIPTDTKHAIVMYLFLDLITLSKQERLNPAIDQLERFPELIGISPKVSKVTKALWLLDHRDFSSAVDALLCPTLSRGAIAPWQHALVLRALVSQGQPAHALNYLTSKQPVLEDIRDIKLQISLLVSTGQVGQALDVQRDNHDSQKSDDLLQQFFQNCWEHNQLEQATRLAFTQDEERALGHFLTSQGARGQDAHVYFFLRRQRVMEAVEVHRRTRSAVRSRTDDRAAFRDTMVNAFAATRPAIERELEAFCATKRAELVALRPVARPTPMSVTVREGNASNTVSYRSSLIHASMAKAREIWHDDEPLSGRESLPFLRTPKSCARNSLASRHSTSVVIPRVVSGVVEAPITGKRKQPDFALMDKDPLLQTPHVQRKTPADQTSAFRQTPHSILKVRQLRSVSEASTVSRQISFTRDDEDVPSRIRFNLDGSETASETSQRPSKQARVEEDEPSESAAMEVEKPVTTFPATRASIHAAALSAEQSNTVWSCQDERLTSKLTVERSSKTLTTTRSSGLTEQSLSTLHSSTSTTETFSSTSVTPVLPSSSSHVEHSGIESDIVESIRRKRGHSSSDNEEISQPTLKRLTADREDPLEDVGVESSPKTPQSSPSTPAFIIESVVTLNPSPVTTSSQLQTDLPLTEEIYIDDPSSDENIFNISAELNSTKEIEDEEDDLGVIGVSSSNSDNIELPYAAGGSSEENLSEEINQAEDFEGVIKIHSVRTCESNKDEDEDIYEGLDDELLDEEEHSIEEEEDDIGSDDEESSRSSVGPDPKARFNSLAKRPLQTVLIPAENISSHHDDSSSDIICLESDDEGPTKEIKHGQQEVGDDGSEEESLESDMEEEESDFSDLDEELPEDQLEELDDIDNDKESSLHVSAAHEPEEVDDVEEDDQDHVSVTPEGKVEDVDDIDDDKESSRHVSAAHEPEEVDEVEEDDQDHISVTPEDKVEDEDDSEENDQEGSIHEPDISSIDVEGKPVEVDDIKKDVQDHVSTAAEEKPKRVDDIENDQEGSVHEHNVSTAMKEMSEVSVAESMEVDVTQESDVESKRIEMSPKPDGNIIDIDREKDDIKAGTKMVDMDQDQSEISMVIPEDPLLADRDIAAETVQDESEADVIHEGPDVVNSTSEFTRGNSIDENLADGSVIDLESDSESEIEDEDISEEEDSEEEIESENESESGNGDSDAKTDTESVAAEKEESSVEDLGIDDDHVVEKNEVETKAVVGEAEEKSNQSTSEIIDEEPNELNHAFIVEEDLAMETNPESSIEVEVKIAQNEEESIDQISTDNTNILDQAFAEISEEESKSLMEEGSLVLPKKSIVKMLPITLEQVKTAIDIATAKTRPQSSKIHKIQEETEPKKTDHKTSIEEGQEKDNIVKTPTRRTTRASSQLASQTSTDEEHEVVSRMQTRGSSKCSESDSTLSQASTIPAIAPKKRVSGPKSRQSPRTLREYMENESRSTPKTPRRAVSEQRETGPADVSPSQFRRTTRASALFGGNTELSDMTPELAFPVVKTPKSTAKGKSLKRPEEETEIKTRPVLSRKRSMSEQGCSSPSVAPDESSAAVSTLEEFAIARRLTRLQKAMVEKQGATLKSSATKSTHASDSDSSVTSPAYSPLGSSSKAKGPRDRILARLGLGSPDKDHGDASSVASGESEGGLGRRKAFRVACESLHSSNYNDDKMSVISNASSIASRRSTQSLEGPKALPRRQSKRSASLEPAVRQSPRRLSTLKKDAEPIAGPSHIDHGSQLQPITEESLEKSSDEERSTATSSHKTRRGQTLLAVTEEEKKVADDNRRKTTQLDNASNRHRFSVVRERKVFLKSRRHSSTDSQ